MALLGYISICRDRMNETETYKVSSPVRRKWRTSLPPSCVYFCACVGLGLVILKFVVHVLQVMRSFNDLIRTVVGLVILQGCKQSPRARRLGAIVCNMALRQKMSLIGTGTFFWQHWFRLRKRINQRFRAKLPGVIVSCGDKWIVFGWEGGRSSREWEGKACSESDIWDFPPSLKNHRVFPSQADVLHKISLYVRPDWNEFMLKCISGALENNIL